MRPAGARESVEIDGHILSLSNRDKILWPTDGFTKGDLIGYYRSVSATILPHLRDRPLTMQRFPNGIDESSFFEKHAPKGLPSWVPTVLIPSESGRHEPIRFIRCNDEATLVYLANLASIVLHVWTSREPRLDTPEFLFFDLDPFDDCTITTLAKVALELHALLGEIELEPLVKTSGGSGLHVVVPLVAEYTYDLAKGFAELVARRLHDRFRQSTTLERLPAKRPPGTVYLDYVQVGKGKTLVAPFSVRARAGAPVSMPIPWSEVASLARRRLKPDRARDTEAIFGRYTIANAAAVLAERGDLWGDSVWHPQRLEPALALARSRWK